MANSNSALYRTVFTVRTKDINKITYNIVSKIYIAQYSLLFQ